MKKAPACEIGMWVQRKVQEKNHGAALTSRLSCFISGVISGCAAAGRRHLLPESGDSGAGGVRAAAAGRRSQENKDTAQADEEDEEPGVGQGLLVEFSPT